jgi:hypothetical protein
MSEWQPIETAPRDFVTTVDLWAGGQRYADCFWGRPTYGPKEYAWCHEERYDSDGPVDELVRNPTHWMPLPEPPQ